MTWNIFKWQRNSSRRNSRLIYNSVYFIWSHHAHFGFPEKDRSWSYKCQETPTRLCCGCLVSVAHVGLNVLFFFSASSFFSRFPHMASEARRCIYLKGATSALRLSLPDSKVENSAATVWRKGKTVFGCLKLSWSKCSHVVQLFSPVPCPVLIKDQRQWPRSSSCCQGKRELFFWGCILQTRWSHCPDARRNSQAVSSTPHMNKMSTDLGRNSRLQIWISQQK